MFSCFRRRRKPKLEQRDYEIKDEDYLLNLFEGNQCEHCCEGQIKESDNLKHPKICKSCHFEWETVTKDKIQGVHPRIWTRWDSSENCFRVLKCNALGEFVNETVEGVKIYSGVLSHSESYNGVNIDHIASVWKSVEVHVKVPIMGNVYFDKSGTIGRRVPWSVIYSLFV